MNLSVTNVEKSWLDWQYENNMYISYSLYERYKLDIKQTDYLRVSKHSRSLRFGVLASRPWCNQERKLEGLPEKVLLLVNIQFICINAFMVLVSKGELLELLKK